MDNQKSESLIDIIAKVRFEFCHYYCMFKDQEEITDYDSREALKEKCHICPIHKYLYSQTVVGNVIDCPKKSFNEIIDEINETICSDFCKHRNRLNEEKVDDFEDSLMMYCDDCPIYNYLY